jgi:hypothetical protein
MKIDPHNKRLDLFLTQLEIEENKKQQILKYVENLTLETLKQNQKPEMRLRDSTD